MPWNVTFRCRKNIADKARRARIDVAIGLDEAFGNCADEIEDARGARVGGQATSGRTARRAARPLRSSRPAIYD
jgi:hypothetical protein